MQYNLAKKIFTPFSPCSLLFMVSSCTSLYPFTRFVNCDKFSSLHRRFLACVTAAVEPTQCSEVVSNSNRRTAMWQEINALKANGSWTLATLPLGKRTLSSNWSYHIKYWTDSSIERYKPCLVVLGNSHKERVDFTDTFAPITKMVTVRSLLSVVAAYIGVHQMDVHNAFFHRDLIEEVYTCAPSGFYPSSSQQVCWLKESLYGLCQAPRCWFSKLTFVLCKCGFV